MKGEDETLEKIFATIIPHDSSSTVFEQTTVGKDIGTDDHKIPGAPFILKTDGPYKDLDESESDAAVTARTPMAPICFSVPRLQNIPPEALEKRILALAAHEFVRHYNNYGEAEALKVQVYVLEHYEELTGKDGFKMTTAFFVDNLVNDARYLRDALNEGRQNDQNICVKMSKAH